VNRVTPLETRGAVAMSGIMGYELALWELTPEEKSAIKKQIGFYKSIQHLILNGDFFRLVSPFGSKEAAWMFVSGDQREAVVFYFQILARANSPAKILHLKGLHPLTKYVEINSGLTLYGDELIYGGIRVPELTGDFRSVVLQFRAGEKPPARGNQTTFTRVAGHGDFPPM
jgi:alpha-galactosidase